MAQSKIQKVISDTLADMFGVLCVDVCKNQYINDISELIIFIDKINLCQEQFWKDNNSEVFDINLKNKTLFKVMLNPKHNLNINWSNIVPVLVSDGKVFGKNNFIDYDKSELKIFHFLLLYFSYNKKNKFISNNVITSLQETIVSIYDIFYGFSLVSDSFFTIIAKTNSFLEFVKATDTLCASILLYDRDLLDNNLFQESSFALRVNIINNIRLVHQEIFNEFDQDFSYYNDDLYLSNEHIEYFLNLNQLEYRDRNIEYNFSKLNSNIAVYMDNISNLLDVAMNKYNQLFNYIIIYNLGKIGKIKPRKLASK